MRFLYLITVLASLISTSFALEENTLTEEILFKFPKGFSYSELANDLYHDSNRWVEIYKLNDIEPTKIPAGSIIKLPSLPKYHSVVGKDGVYYYVPDNVVENSETKLAIDDVKKSSSQFEFFLKVPKGYTYSQIASEVYGSTRYWKEIYNLNLIDPKKLPAGAIIALPNLPSSNVTLQKDGVYYINSEIAKQDKEETEFLFRVPKGHTYSRIARDLYQDTKRWQEIFQLNKVAPTKIEVGSLIKLPEKPLFNAAIGDDGIYFYQPEDLARKLNQESLSKIDDEKLANFYYFEGKKKYDYKKLTLSKALLQRSILLNNDLPAAWVYYLKTIDELGEKEEYEKLKVMFIKKFPAHAAFF